MQIVVRHILHVYIYVYIYTVYKHICICIYMYTMQQVPNKNAEHAFLTVLGSFTFAATHIKHHGVRPWFDSSDFSVGWVRISRTCRKLKQESVSKCLELWPSPETQRSAVFIDPSGLWHHQQLSWSRSMSNAPRIMCQKNMDLSSTAFSACKLWKDLQKNAWACLLKSGPQFPWLWVNWGSLETRVSPKLVKITGLHQHFPN